MKKFALFALQRRGNATEGRNLIHEARLEVVASVLIATLFILPFKYASNGAQAFASAAGPKVEQESLGASGAGIGFGLLVCASLWLVIPALRSISRQKVEVRRRSFSLALKMALVAALGNLFQGYAFSALHAGVATTLIQTSVIFVAVLGALWLKERLSPWGWVATFLALLGVGLAEGGVDLGAMNGGVLWALLAALNFSVMDLISRRYAAGCDPLFTNFIRSASAALLLGFWPHALSEFLALPLDRLAALMLAGLLGPGIARWLLIRASRILPAVESSVIQQLRPALALPVSSLVFGVWPNLWQWIGCAVIFLALALFVAAGARRSRAAAPR